MSSDGSFSTAPPSVRIQPIRTSTRVDASDNALQHSRPDSMSMLERLKQASRQEDRVSQTSFRRPPASQPEASHAGTAEIQGWLDQTADDPYPVKLSLLALESGS